MPFSLCHHQKTSPKEVRKCHAALMMRHFNTKSCFCSIQSDKKRVCVGEQAWLVGHRHVFTVHRRLFILHTFSLFYHLQRKLSVVDV